MPALERTIRTLVVDDSPAMVRMICAVLARQESVEVVATAANGLEAIAVAEKLLPDLVLMDLQMPGLNGLQAAARLSKRFPSMPIVMVTAHDTWEVRRACGRYGICDVMAKEHLRRNLPSVLNRFFPPPTTRPPLAS